MIQSAKEIFDRLKSGDITLLDEPELEEFVERGTYEREGSTVEYTRTKKFKDSIFDCDYVFALIVMRRKAALWKEMKNE